MTTSVAVKFAAGDRVELVEEYGNFFTGDTGTVVSLEENNLVKVKMDKLNEFGRDTITCFSYRLKKAEDRKSKFKVGDRVTVPASLYGSAFAKMDLAIIREKNINGVYGVGAVGSDKAKAHMGEEGGWYSVHEKQITLAPEPTFKTGDYVEVTKENSIFTGKRGWVVETPSYEKEGRIHINTEKKGGEAHYRFPASQLKVTEEPFAPKFKKGDWVEVTKKVNTQWFGIGQIVEERTKDLDISVLKMSSGNWAGHTGGFSDAELIPAKKPVPKSNHVKADFKVGQKVKALHYGGDTHHESAGKTGEVIDIDLYIRVKLEGVGTPLFEPEELEILEQPVVKFQHKLGDYVEGHSWSEDHDGVLYEVVGFNETAWGNYYDLEVVETGEVKYNSFSDKLLKAAEAPTVKSWAEKAKLNQSVISKDFAGRVDRVGIKVSPNEWAVTYPSCAPGAHTAGVSTYNDREVVNIFGKYPIFV